MSSATTKILDLLQRVRQVRPGQWMAACPLCQSQKGRPVAVKEAEDGRVLIHGFCGHESGQIVEALGLSITDLFERPLGHRIAPQAQRLPARDALELMDEEALTVGMIALEFRNHGKLEEADWGRLSLAAARIGRLRDLANGR